MQNCRFVDLSISIENNLPSDPEMMIPEINYIDHEMGAEQMESFFSGLTRNELPEKLGWAIEHVSLTTHSGTHLDAPYHYHPKMNNGIPYGFKISCFPVKIKNAGAGWVRPVAIIPQ